MTTPHVETRTQARTFVAVIALYLVVVAAGALASPVEIRPLSASELQALRATTDAIPTTDPEDVVWWSIRNVSPAAPAWMLTDLDRRPFTIALSTPTSRALAAINAARRRFQPLPVLDLDDLNRPQVVIRVTPGSNLATADSIEDVVIIRGGETVRASAREFGSTTIRNAMNAERQVQTGSFAFPYAVFTGADIRIVCVGQRANYEWRLSAADLAKWR